MNHEHVLASKRWIISACDMYQQTLVPPGEAAQLVHLNLGRGSKDHDQNIMLANILSSRARSHPHISIMTADLRNWGPYLIMQEMQIHLHEECVLLIEYVRFFKSLFMTEVNALYTYDAHQFEALQICRQLLLSA